MSIKENLPIPNAQLPIPNTLRDVSFLELFIINTLCYFDLFDYPLTLGEIQQYLYTGGMVGANYSLTEIKDNLANNKKLKKIIATASGFYFLRGRQAIIETRLERYRLAETKFQIALKAIKWMKFVPFIKLVAVCNNLADFNAKKESDIDLFIVVQKGRLWLVRLALVLLIAIMGLRPPKEKAQDKLCLSFYTASDNLDLSSIKIAADDIYLVYWLATLFPVYQRDEYHERLMESNAWLKKYLPEYENKKISYRYRVEDTKFSRFVFQTKEKFSRGKIGDWLEKAAKGLQLKKMAQNKKDLAVNKKNWVVMDDSMLKFHENDRRLEYLERFEAKRKEIIEKV